MLWKTGRRADRETDRNTDRKKDRPNWMTAHRRTNRQAGRHNGTQRTLAGCMLYFCDFLFPRSFESLTSRFQDTLIKWLVVCLLINWSFNYLPLFPFCRSHLDSLYLVSFFLICQSFCLFIHLFTQDVSDDAKKPLLSRSGDDSTRERPKRKERRKSEPRIFLQKSHSGDKLFMRAKIPRSRSCLAYYTYEFLGIWVSVWEVLWPFPHWREEKKARNQSNVAFIWLTNLYLRGLTAIDDFMQIIIFFFYLERYFNLA